MYAAYNRQQLLRTRLQNFGFTEADIGTLAAAEGGADASTGSTAWRAIAIGVATGVLTLIVNRWVSQVLK